MATIVASIISSLKTIIAAELGVDYQQVIWFHNIEELNIRTAELGFAVRPLSAAEALGVLKFYTVDQDFEIILTDTVARANDDFDRETALNIMYDKVDELFKAIVSKKISVGTNVINITGPSISEPEFINDNKVVILRMQITVRYRSAVD